MRQITNFARHQASLRFCCDRAARWLRGLASDHRGTAATEFAFVITPLAAIMIAILETSLVFFAQQTLETTAEKSVRQLITGTAQKAALSQSAFRTSVCNNLPRFMDCAKLMVDVRTVNSFSGANVTAPTLTFNAGGNVTNSWSYNPGTPGSITVVTIIYIWSVQNGPLSFDLSTLSSNRRSLYATSVFKVEPYT